MGNVFVLCVIPLQFVFVFIIHLLLQVKFAPLKLNIFYVYSTLATLRCIIKSWYNVLSWCAIVPLQDDHYWMA